MTRRKLLIIIILCVPLFLYVVGFLLPEPHLKTADGVVVLAGGDSRARLLEGAKLVGEFSASYLVFPCCRKLSWAQMKNRYRIGDIIPAERVIYGKPGERDAQIDKKYGGTYLEALKTLEISKQFGLRRLVITTEGYHIPRAKLAFRRVFRKAGVQLDFRASRFDPSRNQPLRRRWFNKRALAEIPKWLYGFVFY